MYFQVMPEAFWAEMRMHYLSVLILLKCVDRNMSPIIMFSFTLRLIVICIDFYALVQYASLVLYKHFRCFQFCPISHREVPFAMSVAFFWFSIAYTITRSYAVMYLAARIYDESKKTMIYLQCVPTESWTLEAIFFKEVVGRIWPNLERLFAGSPFFRHDRLRDGRLIWIQIFLFDTQFNFGSEFCWFFVYICIYLYTYIKFNIVHR